MTSKDRVRNLIGRPYAGIILCVLFCAFALPAHAYAKGALDTSGSLVSFVSTLKDGNADELRGVYVKNVMAFPVVQQPAGDSVFVSSDPLVVTQFDWVSRVGNVGLLAHNTLAGKSFSNIKAGDQIILVYGDGHLKVFEMESASRYQTLEPHNPYGHFKDLESQATLSSEQVFNKVYRGEYHLTLQTCVAQGNDPSWGVLFITAKPVHGKDINTVALRISLSNM